MGMEDVIGTRLARHKVLSQHCSGIALFQERGELTPIPGNPSSEGEIEEVYLFDGGWSYPRMLDQIVVKGGRTALLSADDDEIRQQA
jgi:hypothetical protein